MAYASEFYTPENIIGYTGDLNNKPTVYFKNDDHTFGLIKQQNYTNPTDTVECGRDVVMKDQTHTTGMEIAEGIERHTESIQGEIILRAKTTFKPVNDENRGQLARSIGNKKNLRESQRNYYNTILTNLVYGLTPTAEPNQTVADRHKNYAAQVYLCNNVLNDQQNLVAVRDELDGMGLTPSHVQPIPVVVPSYDKLPMAMAIMPKEKHTKELKRLDYLDLATPTIQKKEPEEALKSTLGVRIPDLVGNRFPNHGANYNLPAVKIVPLEDYTKQEKRAAKASYETLSTPIGPAPMIPFFPDYQPYGALDRRVNYRHEGSSLSQSETSGVYKIPVVPLPPPVVTPLIRTQTPSVLGTRPRDEDAVARRTRSRQNPNSRSTRRREDEGSVSRRTRRRRTP